MVMFPLKDLARKGLTYTVYQNTMLYVNMTVHNEGHKENLTTPKRHPKPRAMECILCIFWRKVTVSSYTTGREYRRE